MGLLEVHTQGLPRYDPDSSFRAPFLRLEGFGARTFFGASTLALALTQVKDSGARSAESLGKCPLALEDSLETPYDLWKLG